MSLDELQTEKADLEKQRDDFVTQVNQQIAHLNGQITTVERWFACSA